MLAHAILDSEKIKEESITGKDKGNHPTRIALKKMVKPSPKAAAHSAGTVCALEAKWRATVEGIFSGYVVCLNPQQRGQLKNFLNACLEGRSEVVLEYAVRNWCTFTQRAKSDAAAFNLPTKPDIGFLLKYTGIAVNLWLDAQKAAPLSHPGTCLAPNPTAIQPAAKKSFITEAKATKAEVFAKLGMYPPE